MAAKAYTASNLRIHLWACGALANYFMSGIMFSFMSIVFITSFEMSPAWVGLAMTIPQFVDLVVNPMLGRLSDNTHTRWGRRRPFIFVGTLLGAALVAGIWWMPLSWVQDWKGFVYLLFFSTLLLVNLAIFEMAHVALGYEMSDDYEQRSKVMAVRNWYFSVGGLAGGFTYWLAMRPFFGTGHAGEIVGMRCISLGMAAMILVVGLISVIATQERFQNINKTHVPILQAIKDTLRNRAFVVILVARIISVLGNGVGGSMIAYIGIYSVCQGDKELFNKVIAGWIGLATFALSFLMIPLAVPVTRWLGKGRGLIIGAGLGCLSALALPFVLQPGNVYIWFAWTLLFMPMGIVSGNLLASAMPDICDVDELEHGERREGLFAAVMAFITKIESSLCAGIGGYVLVKTGFDQHLIQQAPEVITKMRFYAFGPMIVAAILTFVVYCFFPLTKKRMDEVRAKLDARHAAIQ